MKCHITTYNHSRVRRIVKDFPTYYKTCQMHRKIANVHIRDTTEILRGVKGDATQRGEPGGLLGSGAQAARAARGGMPGAWKAADTDTGLVWEPQVILTGALGTFWAEGKQAWKAS